MKKRLLITSALMTAVLGASLATGTYAWYQVSAGFTATATTTVATAGNAALGEKALTASWSTIDALNLTDTEGNCKVWNGQAVVDANDDAPVKADVCTLTLSGTDLAGYAGTYTVTIRATDQVRISTGELVNGAVGAYTAGTGVVVGTITISNTGVISYDSVLDINEETADAGLNFNVSVSPDNPTGADTKAPGATYGTLSVVSIA